MYSSIFELIANYGLALVISVYLIWWVTSKLNGKIDRLVNSIDELNENIKHLIYKLSG